MLSCLPVNNCVDSIICLSLAFLPCSMMTGLEICSPHPPLRMAIRPTWKKEPENSILSNWLRPVHNRGRKQTEGRQHHQWRKELILEKGKGQAKQPSSWGHNSTSFRVIQNPVLQSRRWHYLCMSLCLERPPPDLTSLSSWWKTVLWLGAAITFTKVIIVGNFVSSDPGMSLENLLLSSS